MATNPDLSGALDRLVTRLERSLPGLASARAEGELPHVTEGGRWQCAAARQTGRWEEGAWRHATWTGGFVAGQLWLASCLRPDGAFVREARAVVALLAPRADDTTTHDLGFLFWPSAVLGHRVTGDPAYRDLGLRAAKTLCGRLHPAGVLQAWGALDDPRASGRSIVDTMANLPLLWWAESQGDERAGEVARMHARRTAEAFVRDDGSTYHAVRFAGDGTVLERGTIQGLADESTWSRGQAWALHGFADVWRATREAWALEVAERTAGAFLRRLPESGIPPWDFDDPAGAPTDASAAAIAAAGLLSLADAHPDGADPWRGHALSLLDALLARYVSRGTEDGLLLHCCYHVPLGEGVDGATSWGDFFLLDALVHAAAPARWPDPLAPGLS
jgi:unsaturated chondroitin disaccharide hydrolase